MSLRSTVTSALLAVLAFSTGCMVEQEEEGKEPGIRQTTFAATATAPTCTKDAYVQADPGAGFLTMKDDGSVWFARSHQPATKVPELGTDNRAFPQNSGQSIDYCVIKTDDSLWCWGPNEDGVVGTGQMGVPVPITAPVKILEDVKEAEIARYWGCALKNDGTVWCWGNVLETGTIGDGTQDEHIGNQSIPPVVHTPTQVTLPPGVTQIAIGFSHAFALLGDGRVYGWGAAAGYCIGMGTLSETQPLPIEITTVGSDNRYVSAGSFSGLVIKNSGAVQTWGYASGAGGDPTQPISTHYTVSAVGTDVKTAEARMHHNCVITGSGSLWCWGDENPDGQLGNEAEDPEEVIVSPELFAGGFFEGGTPVAEFRMVKSSSCVILEDRSLWCLGVGGYANGAMVDNEPFYTPQEQDWCNNCDPTQCEFVCDQGQCVMCENDDQCASRADTPFCNERTGMCQDTDNGLDQNERASGCGGGARCTATPGRGPARFGAWTILGAAFLGLGAYRRRRRAVSASVR